MNRTSPRGWSTEPCSAPPPAPRSSRTNLRHLLRPRRGWLLLAAVAVAVVVTAGAVGLTRLFDHGVTYGTAALGEIRHTEAPAIGANTFLHREPDVAKIRRELEVLRRAGVGLVRQEFNWAEFEPLDPDEHPDIGIATPG